MKITKGLLFILLILLLGACATVEVKYDYDRGMDFSTVKTYRWDTRTMPGDALAENPLVRKRVIDAVNRALSAKGLRPSDPDSSDLIVVVHAGLKERMQVTDWGRHGWYDPWWGSYGGRVDVSYYTEGTLVIDMVDASRNELVWRGLGTRIVRDYTDPEKMQQVIDETVTKVLASFPPGPSDN
jgi:hypothetical protein